MSPAGVDSLPDELVKEILSNILLVTEDDFAHAGFSSPFGRNVLPLSEVLLVSKRWLRIGSPLLHECVVLRNSAQAGAFHRFIKGKIGVQVRGYIRRVRLEGDFGVIAGKIFAALPNIKDLSLRLPTSWEDNVNGLTKGLSCVNPNRVIIGVLLPRLWKNSSTVLDTLSQQVKQWTNLHILELHFECVILGSEDDSLMSFYEALSTAPYLEQVILSYADYGRSYQQEIGVADIVKILGKSTSLRAIRVHIGREVSIDRIQQHLLGEPCLEKVYFHQKDVRGTACQPQQPCHNSKRLPTLPDNVLGLIIEMDLWGCLGNDPFWVGLKMLRILSYAMRALELSRVSNTFHKVASASAFRFVAVFPSQLPVSIWKRYTQDASILSVVRALAISRFSQRMHLRSVKQDDRVRDFAREFVPFLRDVRYLQVDTEFDYSLERMSEKTKLGVRCLHLRVTTEVFRPRSLIQFKDLTTLILHTDIGCLSVAASDIYGRYSFDRLMTLKIYNQHPKCEVIDCIRSFDFPSVQFLDLAVDDIDTSGIIQSWEEAQNDSWPSFPKVRVIRFEGIPRKSYLLLLQSGKWTVEKLVFSSCYFARESLQHVGEAMIGINFDRLTTLRELHLESVGEWPWRDRELRDDTWQKYAQTLTSRYGLLITNGSGTPWRPRLMKNVKKKQRIL